MTKVTPFACTFALVVAGLFFYTPPLSGQQQKTAFQQGIDASSKGDYDLALASFSEAIRLDPNYVPAYNNRGNIYKARGEYAKAVADYDETVRLAPKYVPAYINRGIARAAMGDSDMALEDYTEAILLDPNNVLAYVNRGLLSESGGSYQKAFEDFELAVHLDAKSAPAYNNLAWLLATCPQSTLRDGRKAVEFANKACELTQWMDPEQIDTLAAACAEAGDFAQAVKLETKYLETPNLAKSSAASATNRLKLYKAGQPYRAGKE